MGWGWLGEAVAWITSPIMYGPAYSIWRRTRDRGPKFTPPNQPAQSAAYGRCVGLVYGTCRLTPNLVQAETIYAPSVTINGSHWFDTGVAALCEGPITGIARVWKDKACYADLAAFTEATLLGVDVLLGEASPAGPVPNFTQQSYYARTALVYGAVAVLGESMGGTSFEVQGFLRGTMGTDDADPTQVLVDFLTDTGYGAGFDASRVQTTVGVDGTAASSARRYVTAEQLGISLSMTDQKPARDWLRDVMKVINCDVIWSDGKLKVLPYADKPVTGGGVTYTPYVIVQATLDATKGDLLADGEADALEIELTPLAETRNVIPVEYLERAPGAVREDLGHAYNASVVESPVAGDVAEYGARKASPEQLHMIATADVAVKVSRFLAQRSISGRTVYRLTVPQRFARLEPLDFIAIRDPLAGLDTPVTARIRSIEESDELDLRIEAEEWPLGTGYAVAHVTASSDGSLSSQQNTWDVEQRLARLALGNWGAYPTPSGSAGNLRGFAKRHERVVLVTGAGIYTSDDLGATWTQRLADTTCADVADDGTTFVVLGGATGVLTSPDGVTWTPATAATTTVMTRVVYADSKFVAMGWSGGAAYCQTSPSGATGTWTARTADWAYNSIATPLSVEFAGKHIVVGSMSSTYVAPTYTWTEFVSVSSDGGLTWSKTQVYNRLSTVFESCFVPSVAIDESGRILAAYGRTTGALATWTLATSDDGGATFTAVADPPPQTRGTWGGLTQPLLSRAAGAWLVIYDTRMLYVSKDRQIWTKIGESGQTGRLPSRFMWRDARGLAFSRVADDLNLLLTISI